MKKQRIYCAALIEKDWPYSTKRRHRVGLAWVIDGRCSYCGKKV